VVLAHSQELRLVRRWVGGWPEIAGYSVPGVGLDTQADGSGARIGLASMRPSLHDGRLRPDTWCTRARPPAH